MEIPKQIKINNHKINVTESPRGYVIVGNTICEINQNKKQHILSLEGDIHIQEWQKEMYNIFERAYRIEKIKRNPRFK